MAHSPSQSRFVDLTRRHYGAHPAHLVVLAAGFAVAAIAAKVLFAERPRDVGGWFIGSAVVHDVILVPAYLAVDAGLVALWRRRPGRWLNHIRVPAAISAVLLVVWFPLIVNKADSFERVTGRSTEAYRPHWMFATAVLFALSGLVYLGRVVVSRARR